MSKGLWANIDAKRKRGEAPAEPGDEDYPDEQTWNELSKTWQDILHKTGRCTRATKKTSSTSKGKKWMKCVSNGKGGHKRVHWGQKGVTVSGKRKGKRRKSFRARHKCSTCKGGDNSPRCMACRDW